MKPTWVFSTLFFLIISCIFPQESQAQSSVQKFEIFVAGFKIGNVVAEEIKKGETTEYDVNSKASFWFFGKIEVGFTIQNIFQNGLLINSNTYSKTNRGDFRSTIIWKSDHYDVDAATYKFENTEPIQKPIYHSSGTFYFHEPKDGDVMVSESYGLVSRVTEKSDGVYEVEINGSRNQYHFVDGKLDKIVVQHPVKNFVVQRVK